MTHDKELELAAEQYVNSKYGSYNDSYINCFQSGAEFQKSRAEVLVNALEYCSKIHFPPKAIGSSEFAQWVIEDNCNHAIEALKAYRGGE